jgi:hypothetical protein
MAKQLSDRAIGRSDISEYLKSEDDFAFELEILRSCQVGGFEARHGGAYQDPVTRKDRQFDIRLMGHKDRSVVKLAIECKNLKLNFPLVVSRIPRLPEESVHDIVISSRSSLGNVVMGKRVRKLTVAGPGVVFRTNEFVGKSTAQVGRAKSGEIVADDAEVYEKWSQALGSAFDLVSSSATDYEIVNDSAAATVVFPVLVIPDKTLWVADYASDGQQLGDPRQVDHCEVFLGKTFDTQHFQYTASHLLVFTKTKFDGYLDRLAVNDTYWQTIFPSEALKQLPPKTASTA